MNVAATYVSNGTTPPNQCPSCSPGENAGAAGENASSFVHNLWCIWVFVQFQIDECHGAQTP